MEYEKIIEKLSELKSYAKDNFVPIIREESAKFLYDYVRNNNIKTILEIGAAIGFSGSIMLSAGAEKLVTVDINAKSLVLAKKTFEMMGFRSNVEIYEADAKDVILELVNNGARFDMIFLDGAKGQYIHYLPNLTKLLNNNGVILADNVLLHGMVESEEKIPHRKRTMVVNLRKYLDTVKNAPYETEIIRIEDGMAITRYKGENLC